MFTENITDLTLKQLKQTLIAYNKMKNRRVFLEYIMLDGVNDTKKAADELVEFIRDLNCCVNLIKYNMTNSAQYKSSTDENISMFYDTLKKSGVNVTKRKEFGSKIDAACGQLRAKTVKKF